MFMAELHFSEKLTRRDRDRLRLFAFKPTDQPYFIEFNRLDNERRVEVSAGVEEVAHFVRQILNVFEII